MSLFLGYSWKPHSRIGSESALLRTALLASNLEILGRGLAAIGNFFVFHRLSFVKRRKASFLDCRNMDKYVFDATRGLNESEALGRVEPLHSTFSHHVVSAGSKTKIGLPVPANRHVRRAGYAVWRALDSLNVRGFWQKTIIIAAYL